MRVLYHYEHSVFSRRTRLALAHKGIEVELKDGREDPAKLAEARSLQPIRTLPVLVENDGVALADSSAIVRYLDIAYPEKPLVPREAKAAREVLAIMTAVDAAMNIVVDLGTRFLDLQNDPAWPAVKDEAMARAHAAMSFVGANPPAGDWNGAHIFTYCAVRWVLAWPRRVASSVQVAKLLKLGFTLPEPLVAWSKPYDDRADVRAIYG